MHAVRISLVGNRQITNGIFVKLTKLRENTRVFSLITRKESDLHRFDLKKDLRQEVDFFCNCGKLN